MSTINPDREASARPKLRCLAGGEAPPGLSRDIEGVAALAPAAKQRFWEALGPSLSEPLPSSVEGILDDFCRRHEAPGAGLASALKGCRFLIREASKVDLPRAALAEDLDALGIGADARAILLGGYDKAKAFVRAEILRGALVGHGKLLLRADYRVDNIVAASDGARFSAPIALVTLAYQEGQRRDQITLQMTPDALRELKKMCEEIIG
jgi:hypothetical protein